MNEISRKVLIALIALSISIICICIIVEFYNFNDNLGFLIGAGVAIFCIVYKGVFYLIEYSENGICKCISKLFLFFIFVSFIISLFILIESNPSIAEFIGRLSENKLGFILSILPIVPIVFLFQKVNDFIDDL